MKITSLHVTMKQSEAEAINNLANENVWAEIQSTFVVRNVAYAQVNIYIKTNESEVKKCH